MLQRFSWVRLELCIIKRRNEKSLNSWSILLDELIISIAKDKEIYAREILYLARDIDKTYTITSLIPIMLRRSRQC